MARSTLLAVAIAVLASLPAGCSSGSDDNTPPSIAGFALYEDANGNGILDAGDELILTFSQVITIGTPVASDFHLPVSGDSLGASPSFAVGPFDDQLTITLGSSPLFVVRGTFSQFQTTPGRPSGIDVSSSITPGSIVGSQGETARSSTPIDIAPGYVDTGQSFVPFDTRQVAQGDFDGDGDLDLYLVNEGQGNRVLLNDGAGVFTDTLQALGSSLSQAAAVGDFDRDGDLDVAVVNELAQTNRVWLNNGSGSFTSGSTFGTGNSVGVFVADYNRDGWADLAVANRGGNTIWLNNRNGTFTSNGQSLGVATSRDVTAIDYDRNGWVDLAFANDGSNGKIWKNTGSGLFSSAGDLVGTTQMTSIVSGDIDIDGNPDLLVGSLSRGVTPFFNVGLANFTAGPSFGSGAVRDVALADIDGDSDLDVVFGRSSGADDQVWLNNGLGAFQDSIMRLNNRSTFGLVVGDHDSDGDLDLFTASLSQSSVAYSNSLNASPGSFSFAESAQELRNNTDPTLNITLDATLADFDGDGDLDYLNGASPNGVGRAWINDGTGTFTMGTAFGFPGAAIEAIASVDLDGDSDLDVVVGRIGAESLVLRNDGNVFTAVGSIAGSEGARFFIFADLDGDGDQDLISNDQSTSARVFISGGAVSLTATAQVLGAFDPVGADVGDIDGDGDLDLVVGRAGAGTLVFLNDGSGTFTDSGQSIGTATTRDVRFGDVDGDGDLDLVEAKDGGNRVWSNDGLGVFTDTLQSLGVDDTRHIALGDMNFDGFVDLVESNAGVASRIRLNDGTGIFIDSGLDLVTDGTARVAVIGDIDLDGDLDVVFGTTEGDRIYFRD